MTQPLSPAAQAVLDAMHRSYDHESTRRAIAAEVLRALADQVLRAANRHDRAVWDPFAGQLRSEILAIAAELEGGR